MVNESVQHMKKITTSIKKPELVASRREQITEAAFYLFRKNGYHATTMRQICERSKVNRASIYDYFGSKADILVYIYKQMLYQDGKFDEAFPELSITRWEDLEPFIRAVISISWNMNRQRIQLLWRETISLDKKSMEDVLRIESNYINWVAENLRRGLGLASVTDELDIIANTMVYFNSFVPLRGWNMRDLDQESILDSVVNMLMMQLKDIKGTEDRRG